MLGNVQQKVSCVFETKVVQEPSTKRSFQPYKVIASDTIKSTAESCHIASAVATEKLDGTCVLVQDFQGKPWLWARLDRKANKAADKKFKKYQLTLRKWEIDGKVEGNRPTPFEWDVQTDLKDVPVDWIPASGVERVDGVPQPDANGHIPGWIPIDPSARQHIWHLSTVDLNKGIALFLQENDDGLEITLRSLKEYEGTTLELIGTNINGNPYQIGQKQRPLHMLVRHGSLGFRKRPPIVFNDLKKWFEDETDGGVEGIVWHCEDGTLFKAHRHHFQLPWPVEKLRLSLLPVTVCVDIAKYELNDTEQLIFVTIGELNGVKFESIKDIMNE